MHVRPQISEGAKSGNGNQKISEVAGQASQQAGEVFEQAKHQAGQQAVEQIGIMLMRITEELQTLRGVSHDMGNKIQALEVENRHLHLATQGQLRQIWNHLSMPSGMMHALDTFNAGSSPWDGGMYQLFETRDPKLNFDLEGGATPHPLSLGDMSYLQTADTGTEPLN